MNDRDLWVPLRIRKAVAEAIEQAEPGETTLAWSQGEAAIDAILPWFCDLLDAE